MKLSFIIPIYNVEKYISKCFDSILNQHNLSDSIEIVAVIDGSPDNSLQVVEEYAQKYSNIVVINQENAGVSAARNRGIEAATGDYITFVDPDDWIGQNSLSLVFCELNKMTQTDILILNSMETDAKIKHYDWTGIVEEHKTYNGFYLFKNQGFLRGSVCGAFYKTEFLNRNLLRFPVGVRNGEDTLFFGQCQSLAEKVSFANIDFYYIYDRPGSASKSITKSNISSYVAALKHCVEFEEKYVSSANVQVMMEYSKYLIFSNYTFQSVQIGLGYKQMFKKELAGYLPIKSEGFPNLKGKVRILNASFGLYYLLVKLKNR